MWLVVELTQLKGSSGSVPTAAANAWTVRKSGFRGKKFNVPLWGPFLQLISSPVKFRFSNLSQLFWRLSS